MYASTDPHAPPFTYDDVIDLHFLLEADQLFLQLMTAAVSEGESQ